MYDTKNKDPFRQGSPRTDKIEVSVKILIDILNIYTWIKTHVTQVTLNYLEVCLLGVSSKSGIRVREKRNRCTRSKKKASPVGTEFWMFWIRDSW